MEGAQADRIEQKLDWVIEWAKRLDPLVKVAEGLAASSSFKLMGRLQRDKAKK